MTAGACANPTSPGPALVLIRHGETAWSREGRHTGITDLGLTDVGRGQALELATLLGDLAPVRVLSSPLRRARETADLAGFGEVVEFDDRLSEWDYGEAEGRTTAEMRARVPDWSVWTHPSRTGEPLEHVARRADALLAELRQGARGEVVLVGHAHLLRILAVRWCGLAPLAGANLTLDAASVSVLGFERETPCIVRWNRAAVSS